MPPLLPHPSLVCLFQAIKVLGLCAAMGLGLMARAQATDLIISEYVEGSASNKYIELYNGTTAAIDLSDYQLRNYSNGSSTPSSVTLSGSLAAGSTIVYQNSAETAYGGAGTNLSIITFNGDDAIALYKVSTSSFVDIFGQIGCDPGAMWTSTSNQTQDRTLVRNANICNGVTTNPSGTCNSTSFPTLEAEWTEYAIDDVSHLGSHTMTCGPTVNFSAATSAALENAVTATINLTISPATTAAETFTVTIGAGTATYGTDYSTTPAGPSTFVVNVPLGATSASFTVTLINDAITEGDETVPFTITGSSGGLSIGSSSSHVFTITDDDNTPTIDFSTLNITVLETAGAQTFTLSFLPTTHPSGSLTIQVTNGPGVVYGSDYTTTPAGGSGTFVVSFGPNVASVSFTATVINDVLAESTETVTFTILSVPVGFAIGANNTATLVIGDNDSPPAVLLPGDLAIVGVNANDNGCSSDRDFISFFCFKEITFGTELILTDNGYERCNAGQWGNTEGTVRMVRTGPAIPAGQVVTFQVNNSGTNVVGMAPDAGWSCTSIGITGTRIALNNGGEQIFFMQGGTWNPGNSNAHNATYTGGSVLYAFSTNPSPPWTAHCSTDPNQRSNLPPGVECFSMAPTSATDFSKYIGPTTSATQRDWIIRIDNTANWSSYPDCNQYWSNGYNWSTAPILPITPGTMTHGLWRGAINGDWFECKNWDDARIPDAATNVVVNATANLNCIVGLSTGLNPGGTGVCATFSQVGGTGTKHMIVDVNSTLNVGGLFRIDNTGSASTLYSTVSTNATLNAGSVEIRGYDATVRSILRAQSIGGVIDVGGNLTIDQGGSLVLGVNSTNYGTCHLGGNFINTQGELNFDENYGRVVMDGTGDQYIQNSNPVENFYDLQVNKPGGDVYLTAPIAIRHQLDLTQGRIFSTPTDLVTLNSGATAINASDASFVHGPLARVGNTPFTFPVGKGTSYRPCGLLDITATSTFTAEYFPVNPETAIGPLVLPTTLHHISHCEYWTIDRNAGGNARVQLSWDTPESCGVTNGALFELRVARWNGSNWDDRGNGGYTGTFTAGTIVSAAVETAFSPWTLASVTANNPLPIELLSFTATPNGSQVDLRWSTASEQGNAFFTVERGTDGNTFDALWQVPGAGNSQTVQEYADRDASPLPGLSYYRLRQTDFDGTTTVSPAVPVLFRDPQGHLTVVYGTDGTFVQHDFAAGSTMEVLDATGRMAGPAVSVEQGAMRIPADHLAHGAYLVRITDGLRSETVRFVH